MTASLATVTVTFHPDAQLLCSQLSNLPANSRKLLVDNGSPETCWNDVTASIANISGVEILRLERNHGLASALNLGVRHIANTGDEEYVLLLDQDSVPLQGSVELLQNAYVELASAHKNTIGAVGPVLQDPKSGFSHGFHVMTKWRWKRVYPQKNSPPVKCSTLNGSGTFTKTSTFLSTCGMDDALFIDHVDTEWSFRLIASGHQLWGIPSSVFLHNMGNNTIAYWMFGWHLWPSRSPHRHYYLFRNATSLMRRKYIPATWKIWCAVKLLFTAIIHATLDTERSAQLQNMARGINSGLTMKNPAKQ